MITADELKKVKNDLNSVLTRRSGQNKPDTSQNDYAGQTYGSLKEKAISFTQEPTKGGPVYFEYGEKPVSAILNNFYDEASAQCAEKKTVAEEKNIDTIRKPVANAPIQAESLDYSRLHAIVDRLDKETKASNGVTEASKAIDGSRTSSKSDVEVSSCRTSCSGICVGSCIGNCNGCSGCSGGCNSSCSGGCGGGCRTGCKSDCTSGCYSGCTGQAKATTLH